MIYKLITPTFRLAMCIRDFFVLIDVLIMSSDSIFLIKISSDKIRLLYPIIALYQNNKLDYVTITMSILVSFLYRIFCLDYSLRSLSLGCISYFKSKKFVLNDMYIDNIDLMINSLNIYLFFVTKMSSIDLLSMKISCCQHPFHLACA